MVHTFLSVKHRSLTGFTLVEVILVLALFGALLGIGLPIGVDSYKSYLLTAETRTLVSFLRRAQNFSLANTREASHGLFIDSSRFVLFQGSSYAGRNATYDEVYLRSSVVTVSSTPEIVFTPLSGIPMSSTTITLSNGLSSQAITVNAGGAFLW